MAFQTYVGSVSQAASTGNVAYTGVGFQPKAILFFGNSMTADGNAQDGYMSFGFGVSSSDRRAVYSTIQNAAGPGSGGQYTCGHDNTKVFKLLNRNATTSVIGAADLVSLDADGFTLNWTTTDGTARIVNYVALGGSDLTNAQTGQVVLNNTTSNQAVTGLGFQPECLIFIQGRATSAVPPSDANSPIRQMIGYAASTNMGISLFHSDSNGGGTFKSKNYQRTAKSYGFLASNGASVGAEGTLISFDSDGFTINTNPATNIYLFYIALKGGNYKVGSFNQNTSTGNQSVSGVGFQPSGLLMSSTNAAASTSIQAQARLSVGAASGTSNRFSIWMGSNDGSANADADYSLDRGKILEMNTENGTVALTTEADLSSFDSGGFTINNTTVDATSREVLYLAFGSSASTVRTLATLGVG